MERYHHKEKIGKGAYGVVYKSRDQQTDKMVAIKKIRLEVEDEGIPATALREISYLRMLQFIRHPNIVFLENIIIEGNRLHLIFELVEGDLKKLIDTSGSGIPLNLVQTYTSQIFNGLAYMHSMGIMHRDLKPQNLLVGPAGIKIADFGLARSFSAHNRPLSVEVVTRYYRPPEILLGSCEYTAAVDVWSVGCIIAEMSCGSILFQADSEIDLIHRIFRRLGTPKQDSWPEFPSLPFSRNNFPKWDQGTPFSIDLPNLNSNGLDLLDQIFLFSASDRISASAALRHAFCWHSMSPTQTSPSLTTSRLTPIPLHELTSNEGVKKISSTINTIMTIPSSSSTSSSSAAVDLSVTVNTATTTNTVSSREITAGSSIESNNTSFDSEPLVDLPLRRRSPRTNGSLDESQISATVSSKRSRRIR